MSLLNNKWERRDGGGGRALHKASSLTTVDFMIALGDDLNFHKLIFRATHANYIVGPKACSILFRQGFEPQATWLRNNKEYWCVDDSERKLSRSATEEMKPSPAAMVTSHPYLSRTVSRNRDRVSRLASKDFMILSHIRSAKTSTFFLA